MNYARKKNRIGHQGNRKTTYVYSRYSLEEYKEMVKNGYTGKNDWNKSPLLTVKTSIELIAKYQKLGYETFHELAGQYVK